MKIREGQFRPLRSFVWLCMLAAASLSVGVSRAQLIQAQATPNRISQILDTPPDNLITTKRMTEFNKRRLQDTNAATAKLLALASELKSETEEGNKAVLTVAQLKKVQQIEKLAHTIHERMAETLSPSLEVK